MLFIGNVGYRFNSFALSSSVAAQKLGIEFHIAGNWSGYDDPADRLADEKKYGIKIHQIDFIRTPYDPRNIKAYRQIVQLIREEKIDYIHCNTPIGGVVGRLAGKKCKVKKVIYQAHGFHFCKNAPRKNWLFYFPVEWLLAYWTDVLITINEEDHIFAKNHMHAKKIEYVPGVGIDLNKFEPNKMSEAEKAAKRASLGLSVTDKVFVSVGEVNVYKNHILMIKALQKLSNSNYKYIVCGIGPLKDEYEKYIRDNGLDNCVKLLGYRTDITEILQIADVFVHLTDFEGLPRAIMEAIASKIMVICSASRGNTDLVKDKRCLFDYRSVEELIQAIHNVENMTEEERNAIIEDNYSRLLPREKSAVIERMKEIYKETEGMSK